LIFIPLMLIPSAIFWLRSVAKIRMDVLMIVLNKNRNLFRLLTCGLVDHNKFIRDYKGHHHHSDAEAHHEAEMGAREQEGPAETMGADEEIVEIEGEESAGAVRRTALKRM
jgi:hypothetical protein